MVNALHGLSSGRSITIKTSLRRPFFTLFIANLPNEIQAK